MFKSVFETHDVYAVVGPRGTGGTFFSSQHMASAEARTASRLAPGRFEVRRVGGHSGPFRLLAEAFEGGEAISLD